MLIFKANDVRDAVIVLRMSTNVGHIEELLIIREIQNVFPNMKLIYF